jgi:hypothetical protein
MTLQGTEGNQEEEQKTIKAKAEAWKVEGEKQPNEKEYEYKTEEA